MALQSSGAISINDIRVELGQSQADSSLRRGDGQQGYGDYSQACAEAYDSITLYSSSTSLSVNVILYTDDTLTTEFAGGDLWYKSGSTAYAIDNTGKITAVRSC